MILEGNPFRQITPPNSIRDLAKLYCRLTGLTFLAVSGDGWLDVVGQRDINPAVWYTQLQTIGEDK